MSDCIFVLATRCMRANLVGYMPYNLRVLTILKFGVGLIYGRCHAHTLSSVFALSEFCPLRVFSKGVV